jgi:hypothetical protein
MSRTKLLYAVVAIGATLAAAPFAISLPGKASAGQRLIDNLHPYMQPASVTTTARYYDKTFVRLRPVAQGGSLGATEAPQLIATLAKQLRITPSGVERFLGSGFPALAQLIGSLPQLDPVFANVGAGLDHYKPLVRAMQSNVRNYASTDSLPDLRQLTWFFVAPGLLLILLGGSQLVAGRRDVVATARPSVA